MTTATVAMRVYLFGGLAAHKMIWEMMKRRQPRAPAPNPAKRSPALLAVKGGKVAVLLGLFVQLFLPEILPITVNPLPARAVGIIVFTLGLLIAVSARIELDNNWSDIEVGKVQEGHALVNGGVYRYIRHPIYAGDLAMLLGFELALNSWLVLGVVAIAIPTVSRAVREEKVLARTVAGYDVYCEQTKRFIPFVF